VVVLKDYSSIGMGFQILLGQIDFGFFSHGCREEDYPHSFCPGCYVHDNCDLYCRFSSDVDKAGRLLFPEVLVLILLPMLIDYFNG
jgi:hypothetical protein